ncbi:solute carrier family 2, facilitated glucose transporter member 5-like [Python bivittatus]|uniref:Solute carrier family 2, facilitated glucose transporter member 5 n=1 Tax=Python bivittatus TaxID=176946 RepID=A0A9F5MUK7_PYTBI|nr:solute carrier family 2, facilitated glucose transporter member 5-like [Python bivittatus]
MSSMAAVSAGKQLLQQDINALPDGGKGFPTWVRIRGFRIGAVRPPCQTFGSSLQYGYNLWVVNHPFALIQDFFNATSRAKRRENIQANFLNFLFTLTATIYSLGGLIGSLMVCPMADTCGRKGALMITNLLAVISAILMGFSTIVQAYEYTVFSRLISGVCSGIFSCAVPMYLAEIAPRNLRGATMTMAMIAVAVGVLVSQILSLREILGSKRGWPILLSFTGILAAFQLLVLPRFPESPRFLLIQKKNEEKARQVLRILRDREDVEEEIDELHQEDISELGEKEMNGLKLLTYEGLRWQMISVIILMGGQQFTGVNAVYYYAEKIYKKTWLNKNEARYISILSSVFVIFTLLVVTYTIDTVGRRILILVGFSICSTLCVLLTITLELQATTSWMPYVTSSFLFLFLIGHLLGPGPLPNVIIAELFLQSSRSTGVVLGGFIHWFLNFFTGVVVLHIEAKIGSYCFLLFWPFCIASFVFIFRTIPETKNKTFLEIRRLMAVQVAKKVHVQVPDDRLGPRSRLMRLNRKRRRKHRTIQPASFVPSVPSI